MPTNRRTVKGSKADLYCTPPWATHALMQIEKFEGKILEPCCGHGHISKVLKQYYPKVKSQDLYDYGYGKSGRDFLKHKKPIDNIITNPPFNIANSIVLHALKLANNKVALFLRTPFLEGVARYNTIFKNNPPTTIWVFVERVSLYPPDYKKGKTKINSGTTCYSWFIWNKNKNKKRTRIRWIKPGFKSQFSKQD